MNQPPENQKVNIDIQPIGRRVEIDSSKSVLAAVQNIGVDLVSLCGGEGSCNGCVVRIVKGDVNPITEEEDYFFSEEEISSGLRLACQTLPASDLVIDIPPDSLTTPQRLQVEGIVQDVHLDPVVKFIDLTIPPPSLDDLRSDTARLQAALKDSGYKNIQIQYPLLEELSDILREYDWKVRAVLRKDEVIAILRPQQEIFGLAVDIGTTKTAVYLLSLESGEVVDMLGEMNPQIAYGEDVISRIGYTIQNEDGRQLMQEKIVETINLKISEMCKKVKISTGQIVDAVVVGNTAMHHLFAGLPVKQLGLAPYVPSVSKALDLQANRVNLKIASGAYIYMLPNIAGFVGADHSAVILASKLWETKKNILAIDIGTNTEITLATKGNLISCSCASGPAFEGAHIKDGMRAAPGAIERIQIADNDEINIVTIENQPPVGICGSGILDAVAELRSVGAINRKGAFTADQPRVRRNEKNKQEYLLVDAAKTGHGKDITVTRYDINEIQVAKSAIRSGLEILLTQAGISAVDVDEVIIAGAFGSYINVKNAIKIGMFPDIPLQRFRQVGNAAGMGARLALLSGEQRETIQAVVEKTEYIELTASAQFQPEFVKAMFL